MFTSKFYKQSLKANIQSYPIKQQIPYKKTRHSYRKNSCLQNCIAHNTKQYNSNNVPFKTKTESRNYLFISVVQKLLTYYGCKKNKRHRHFVNRLVINCSRYRVWFSLRACKTINVFAKKLFNSTVYGLSRGE